jgi:hypothetical protein
MNWGEVEVIDFLFSDVITVVLFWDGSILIHGEWLGVPEGFSVFRLVL